MTPFTDQDVQLDIFRDAVYEGGRSAWQCTRDEYCRAEADAHEPDCPVEQRLRDELGF